MNPYRDTSTIEAEDPDHMETDFELLNRKFEHAIRAAFFLGSIVGMSAAVLMFLVFLLTHK